MPWQRRCVVVDAFVAPEALTVDPLIGSDLAGRGPPTYSDCHTLRSSKTLLGGDGGKKSYSTHAHAPTRYVESLFSSLSLSLFSSSPA